MSSVKDPFLGLPLVNYHLRKKIYINFILYFLLYCILLYLCLCTTSTLLKIRECWYDATKNNRPVIAFDKLNKSNEE